MTIQQLDRLGEYEVVMPLAAQADRGPDAWVIALVSALLGALIGALIAVGYDLRKTRRLEQKRDRMVALLLMHELGSIRLTFDSITRRIAETDLGLSLPRPWSDIWEILRVGFPQALAEDDPLMGDIRVAHYGANRIRELVHEREALRQSRYQVLERTSILESKRVSQLQELARTILDHIADTSESIRAAEDGLRQHFPETLTRP